MKIIQSLIAGLLLSLVAAVHADQGSSSGPVAISPHTQLVAMNFTSPLVTDRSLLQSLAPQALRDLSGVINRIMGAFNKLSINGGAGVLKDGIAKVNVVPTPEPSTYLAMGSFLVIGGVVAARRRRALRLRV